MFNRIRDALARTRSRRRTTRGRHRLGMATPVRPATVPHGGAVQHIAAGGPDAFAGEETALVRPYVVAAEARARHAATSTSLAVGTGGWVPGGAW